MITLTVKAGNKLYLDTFKYSSFGNWNEDWGLSGGTPYNAGNTKIKRVYKADNL